MMLWLAGLYQLVVLGIYSLFVRMGTRLAKLPGTTWNRVLAASVLAQFVPLPVLLLWRAVSPWINAPALVSTLAECLISVDVILLVFMAVLRTSLRRALVVWLATLPGLGISLALTVYLVIPYLFQAFHVAGNSMAPTLLGEHILAACPRCGGPGYGSKPMPGTPTLRVPTQRERLRLPPKTRAIWELRPPREAVICGRCLQVSKVVFDGPSVMRPADRILVDRLASPKRWDVIVFCRPREGFRPSGSGPLDVPRSTEDETSVQRLVGLPNETVSIQEGAIWINGCRQVPPPSIERLVYHPEPGAVEAESAGAPARRSWSLGPDEYFVLGDFSIRARDSRLWTEGRPDHHPFAVPRADVVGVGAYIYWPPRRWRSLR